MTTLLLDRGPATRALADAIDARCCRDVAAMIATRDATVAFLDVIDVAQVRHLRAARPDLHIVLLASPGDPQALSAGRAAAPADRVSYLLHPVDPEEAAALAAALRRRVQAEGALAGIESSRGRDPLTGAADRHAFCQAIADRAGRSGPFAVAIVDLDRFRLVNDTLGHAVGDALLVAACATLQAEMPGGGLVARLGADEFGLLFDAPGAPAAAMTCERLIHACRRPVTLHGHELEAAACAGLVLAGPDTDADDLLRRADLALGDARSQGRNHVCLFDEGLDDALRMRRRIERGLTHAVARGEMALAFQPIVAREGHEIVGFEALLRWEAGEDGPISPSTFIPIAEESALIHTLGDWVLERSLAAVADWPGQYVSVNFSPRQFRRPNFVAYVMERCQRAGVVPQRLQIEITETAIFDDADHAAETLYRLRQMGFRIALDDFGTGYSSLYNIRKFPLDALKIDPSFVDGMGREREASAVVQAVIHLAEALGLSVIAEGVETAAQVDLLHVAGASHLQGFHFAPAVDAAAARVLAQARVIDGTLLGHGTLPMLDCAATAYGA